MEEIDIAVIGGGPAGLRAAEVAAQSGLSVIIFDAKPGLGRKFLVAGKGGLNITHGEDFEAFSSRYSGGEDWAEMLSHFTPSEMRKWCLDLGQETFQASSGRVYPKALKGAPVLRAWLSRLKDLGVEIRTKHQWKSLISGNVVAFTAQPEVQAKAVIFALGGASWPKTGSDGGWVKIFHEMGIRVNPLTASNCGWECSWDTEFLEKVEGLPIKNISVRAGEHEITGELLVTRYGLEGGTIYALGRQLREMENPHIIVDFKPTFSVDQLIAKISRASGDLLKTASKAWRLNKPAVAMLSGKTWESIADLAAAVKSWRIELTGPRPIAEAISSAGGVSWEEIDHTLMLKKLPGVFVSGEMMDWDAPTGGYLLQGAFATGTRAGASAADFVKRL